MLMLSVEGTKHKGAHSLFGFESRWDLVGSDNCYFFGTAGTFCFLFRPLVFFSFFLFELMHLCVLLIELIKVMITYARPIFIFTTVPQTFFVRLVPLTPLQHTHIYFFNVSLQRFTCVHPKRQLHS
jgi:hypothetical protein